LAGSWSHGRGFGTDTASMHSRAGWPFAAKYVFCWLTSMPVADE
jgi:hypothetical protein